MEFWVLMSMILSPGHQQLVSTRYRTQDQCEAVLASYNSRRDTCQRCELRRDGAGHTSCWNWLGQPVWSEGDPIGEARGL